MATNTPAGAISQRQYITEFHQDIVRSVPSLPAASSYTGTRVFYQNQFYYSDGTRWLSVQTYRLPMSSRGGTMPFAQATSFFDTPLSGHSVGNGVYITALCSTFKSSTIQSGINFYTASLSVSNSSGSSGVTLGGTTTTQAFTNTAIHNLWEPTVTPTAFDSTYYLSELTLTPSGAPGTFIFFAVLSYQLIGS
jgi:hypothetical protein